MTDDKPMEEFVALHSATVVCSTCAFVVHIDGGATEDEMKDLCLQVEKMHSRQRHGDVTAFQTKFGTYDAPNAPTDAQGRPERMN